MESEPQKRILVVKLSSLGDHFHALPAVHGLKTALDATIDWVTQPEYEALVRCFIDVDRVITFPRKRFVQNASKFIKELRTESYDYVVDFQGLLKSAWVSWLARGRRRIGPSYSRECAHWFYTDIAGEKDKNRHAVEEALDVIKYLKLPEISPAFPLAFPEASRTEQRPRIAMLPVSRWPSKNWPVDHFIQLGRSLREKLDASIFVIGGPNDHGVCSRMTEGIGEGTTNLAGQTTLVSLGSLLQEMDLCVTVDSGPMHMAAALNVPVLALFGPTDPVKTGPYGDAHRVIAAERAACWPCRKRICPDCESAMKGITPEVVTKVAADMLG